MEALVFAALFWIAPIVVGHGIGSEKGRAGWLWALFLGWIGVIVVAYLSDKRVPSSAAPIDADVPEKEPQIVDFEAELAKLRERKAQLAAELGVELTPQPNAASSKALPS